MGVARESTRALARGEREQLTGRALDEGVDTLGPGELVALVLGRRPLPSLERDLGTWSRASAGVLQSEAGLPGSLALRLAAAFALGRRVERSRRRPRPTLRSAEAVYRHLAPSVRGLEREHFQVLLLDGKHRLVSVHAVSQGTLTSSLVHPREVFRPAIREAAAAIVVAHNHPSGDPEPSAEDLEVTRRLAETGRLLGIPLLDHVVLGDGSWTSLRERMELG